MRSGVTGLLILFWMVIGYFALLWAAKQFFGGRYRAETASAAVVVAFILGANWPHRFSIAADGPSVAVAPAQPTAVVTQTAQPAVDVGAACASARLSTVAGKGNLDSATVQTGSLIVPAGSVATLRSGDTLIAQGWAANDATTGAAASVCAVVDGAILPGLKVLYGGSRPDVASAYQNPAMSPTAYEITLPSARVAPGSHRIQAAAVMADGSAKLVTGEILVAGPPTTSKLRPSSHPPEVK